MRSRIPIRRILLLRPFRPPNSHRLFTQNTLLPRLRPHLPFLSPLSKRARFTTETKQWIKSEFRLAGKYTVILWATCGLVMVIAFGVQQEWLDRQHPSPREWSWLTRSVYRGGKMCEEEDKLDWVRSGESYQSAIRRLEDPNIDGAGLQEGEVFIASIGKPGFDISSKSEPWRRGYYEVLMGAARAAEHLDDCVRDKTRSIIFPKHFVIGPSNPKPRPMPPGPESAPKEEDCEPAFEPPETYYVRILTTVGFTEKQRMDAALAYGAWLDYKNAPETALEMYKWALDIVSTGSNVIDVSTGVLNTTAGLPTANILTATTALATHHARNSNLSLALPIFLSILRTRKSLPDPPQTMYAAPNPDDGETGIIKRLAAAFRWALIPPSYPPPPSDGTTPPLRTPKERCEEAAVMTYIGEIIYASRSSKTNREEGLAWTREAVDIAEAELRQKKLDGDGKKVCKQCLDTSLENWMIMVAKLAKEEKDNKYPKAGGWLGFTSETPKSTTGRWESEVEVIKERMRRAKEITSSFGTASGGPFWSM